MSSLTSERLKQLLEYDPNTGKFTWRVSRRNITYSGNGAGAVNQSGRLMIYVDGKHYQAHRLVWLYVTGEFPKLNIDHKDGNPLNNSWGNLRLCTLQENNRNARTRKDNALGVKGVRMRRGKYQVRVNSISYGTYEDLELAQHIATEVRNHLHGEFARHA